MVIGDGRVSNRGYTLPKTIFQSLRVEKWANERTDKVKVNGYQCQKHAQNREKMQKQINQDTIIGWFRKDYRRSLSRT